MPIEWSEDDFQQFFGKVPQVYYCGDSTNDLGELDYRGQHLKYKFQLHLQDEIVCISGCVDLPFGADSLYEICIPCDSITRGEDGYYPDQVTLHFWYGDSSKRHNMTMMLLKRPDGDLKVWPGCVFPPRHSNFKMVWGDNNPPVAYEPPRKQDN